MRSMLDEKVILNSLTATFASIHDVDVSPLDSLLQPSNEIYPRYGEWYGVIYITSNTGIAMLSPVLSKVGAFKTIKGEITDDLHACCVST